MLRDDYLIRLIRRAADMVARALRLLDEERPQEGQTEQADAQAREALRQLVRLPLDNVVLLDAATLRTMMSGGDADAARTAARALYVLGKIAERNDDGAVARQRFVRAMDLYASAGLGDDAEDHAIARDLATRFRAPADERAVE
jgi:hypothetical protein